MGKKEKLGVGKIVKRVNKEFEKTTEQIESLISDALKQLDHLQNQLQEPIRKILDEMDRIREREFARFQDEFDRRVQEFQELQNSLLERVGLPATSKRDKTDKVESKPAAPAKPQAKTSANATSKAAATKPAKAKAAKTPAKPKPAAKPAAAKVSKTKAEPKLSDIKGVGPATIKKMNGAGITSVKQIANPTPEEKKKLDQFSTMKGYDGWQEQARKLLG